ncbi:unnamed protein product [Lymnaea stagnalis]|uniref:Cytohesin Ubiquitin Protein Inducing domain-containing protein n=1 Tax=Lymnaea stagnalis TaxID=6523 RepID=A0AAV2IEF8_LYMST
MAVAQHQFYLDKKQSKTQLPSARSMSEIAAELCRSTTSLPGSLGSDISRSPSSHSLPSLSNSRYDLTIEQSDSLKAERDMYQALKARKEALEDALRKKTEELKLLCLQEGELTGELPKETPLAYGEPLPVFRRRVGTAFSLSVKSVQDINSISSELSKLELEVDLQCKITSAAQRLASDKTVSKYVRKQRKQSYIKANAKLKDMEKKLAEMQKQVGKSSVSEPLHRTGRAFDDRGGGGAPGSSNKTSNQMLSGRPPETVLEEQNPRTALSPSHSSPQLSAGYNPNGGVASRRQNRGHAYPATLTTRNSSDLDSSDAPNTLQLAANLRLDGSHDSGFSSANNMYNVNSQRTSHYESTDQLRSPATSEPGIIYPGQSQMLHEGGPQYGGIKRTENEPFLRATPNPNASNLHYGSLDRKRRDYRQDFHRDVSPVRYKSRHFQDNMDYNVNRSDSTASAGFRDISNPAGVVVEVPVHHERGHSVPPSSAKQAWGEAAGLSVTLPSPEHDRPKPPPGGLSTSSFSSEHCYSPRMYEGVVNRTYQDIDVTHVHSKDRQDRGLAGAHHTSSQPVFHRTERSISPLRAQQQNHPHHFHQPQGAPPPYQQQRPPPPTGFDRQPAAQQQHNHHYSAAVSSPTNSQPSSYFSESPRTIPIQRIETPPSSASPTAQYAQGGFQGGSPASSGPSSPRGPATHATSALVTVTRLQPHTEVTKPYEISDFYRYSEKLRRQRIIDQYQRQLIGVDRMSRSSSPLSVDSEGHSSRSGSQHSASSGQANQSPAHQPVPFSSSSSLKQTAGRPPQPYSRSVSAPLSSMQPTYYTQTIISPSKHAQPLSPTSHLDPSLAYPEGQMTSSSSSSYTVKTHGPNVQYAMQSSSTYKIQQVHSSAKHSMYQPPQPMTCKPVRTPPTNLNENQRR